ncbi:hypothetical protein BJV74DRAFT_852374 [Russula compacta]|nr:hypothetical protein BJV74DRAFT_852374 [Russula compacta]
MSTFSLPGYSVDTLPTTPSYSPEPLLHETHQHQHYRSSPFGFAPARQQHPPGGGEFVKDSKRGNLRLRLSGQASDNVAVPVFGIRGPVEGTLELLKTDSLAFVAVRVDGLLKVEEIAGGGMTKTVLCDQTVALWRKDVNPYPCPFSLPIRIPLPTTFRDEHGSWSLPPTYEAHLNGLPGFTASVEYSMTAIASKTNTMKLGIGGATTVSTPFIYHPRARPARGIPPRLEPKNASPGLRMAPEWRVHESVVRARIPGSSSKTILCKFYIPASHVLCMRRAIPYHITFTGAAQALTTLLTYLPSRTGAAPVRACSRIQVLRQTTVDVNRSEYTPVGATSEMWRTRSVGEGSLYRTGDGPDWLSFAGEISVDPVVTIGGFRAAALWVKDCIVFSITPPDPLKGQIGDLRCVIPIRLVTDPAWGPNAGPLDASFVPQASPTPSEAHDSVTAVDSVLEEREGDAPRYERDSYLASEDA